MKNETKIKLIESNVFIKLNRHKFKLQKAKNYLKMTDYIVIKINEAVIKGQDTSELLSKYADQFAKRETYRNSIDALEAEVKTLEKEWREERARIIAEEFEEPVEELKASEEAKNDESIEDVIKQPTNTPTEEVTEVEETITEELLEETPSEQPIKETPTEVVENLE